MSLPAIHKDERPNQCFWNAAPVNARYFDAFGGTVSFVRLTFLRSGACGLSVPAARRAASREPSRGSGGAATAARRPPPGGGPRWVEEHRSTPPQKNEITKSGPIRPRTRSYKLFKNIGTT